MGIAKVVSGADYKNVALATEGLGWFGKTIDLDAAHSAYFFGSAYPNPAGRDYVSKNGTRVNDAAFQGLSINPTYTSCSPTQFYEAGYTGEDLGDITGNVSVWALGRFVNVESSLVSGFGAGGNPGFALSRALSGIYAAYQWNAAAAASTYSQSAHANTGSSWDLIVATFSASTATISIRSASGVSLTTSYAGSGDPLKGKRGIRYGRDWRTSSFQGATDIASGGVYTKLLTQPEINQLYLDLKAFHGEYGLVI